MSLNRWGRSKTKECIVQKRRNEILRNTTNITSVTLAPMACPSWRPIISWGGSAVMSVRDTIQLGFCFNRKNTQSPGKSHRCQFSAACLHKISIVYQERITDLRTLSCLSLLVDNHRTRRRHNLQEHNPHFQHVHQNLKSRLLSCLQVQLYASAPRRGGIMRNRVWSSNHA